MGRLVEAQSISSKQTDGRGSVLMLNQVNFHLNCIGALREQHVHGHSPPGAWHDACTTL